MIIKIETEKLSDKGVYQIKNLQNGKIYIGSTIMSFLKRFYHHQSMLRVGKHKNNYLQNSFNKYGEDNFEFSILEVCSKENCLEREQYYIDKFEVIDKNKGYNINPLASGTSNMSKETIEKRRQTMLRKYASGELDHIKEITRRNNNKRKGTKLLSSNHLKVPKTITEKLVNSRKIKKEKLRENKFPEIFVYDLDYNFLGKWRSSIDLEEWSGTQFNDLPIKSRFPKGRIYNDSYKNPMILKSSNIQTSIKNKTPYKSLYFSYKPLHQVIDDKEQSELLENPNLNKMDNQQPSLGSNILEGSTTNSQIPPDKTEDSNADKSALPTIICGDDIV